MSPSKRLASTIATLLCLTTALTTALASTAAHRTAAGLTATQQQRLPAITKSSRTAISSSIGVNSLPHATRLHHHEHHQRPHPHLNTRQLSQQTAAVSRAATTLHPDHDVEIIGQPALATTKPTKTTAAPWSNQRRAANSSNANASSHLTTTRLRRINGRDYHSNGSQRRGRGGGGGGNNDWSYNTYNVQTNTFGPPPPPPPYATHTGKGDDNTLDVEFIGSSNSRPDWIQPAHPRRSDVGGGGYPAYTTTAAPATSAPPPLVPARRGYMTTTRPKLKSGELSPVTEDPFETNTISRNPHPGDTKDMERRHICVQQRTITMPVKTTEVYMRPIWRHVNTPCQPPTYPNQMCTRVQLVHEQAYRDVIRHKSAQHVTFDCCTGWMRETPHADACMKPVCTSNCQNGGSCAGPDTCTCPAGFTGRHCEHDINECKEEKPCDQTCINTVGSYYCKCRAGFVLQSDQQSCKKIDYQDDDAFEARDLENEIETETEVDEKGAHSRNSDVTARLHKIERSLANERVHTNELQKSLQATYHVVDTLKSRLNTLEKQQQDLNRIQTNLYETETRTNKLEGMVNLLMKCRNGPNAYCP